MTFIFIQNIFHFLIMLCYPGLFTDRGNLAPEFSATISSVFKVLHQVEETLLRWRQKGPTLSLLCGPSISHIFCVNVQYTLWTFLVYVGDTDCTKCCSPHKESKPTCCAVLLLICNYISNMVWPDLLAIFRESHAAMFQLRIISCGYTATQLCGYTIVV